MHFYIIVTFAETEHPLINITDPDKKFAILVELFSGDVSRKERYLWQLCAIVI